MGWDSLECDSRFPSGLLAVVLSKFDGNNPSSGPCYFQYDANIIVDH